MAIRKIISLILIISFSLLNFEALASANKYPDYADMFLGADKHETFNRKMFDFNYGLNLFLIKPIHIIWSSVMPKYGMDRFIGVSENIEYPIRLMSSLVQGDFHNAGNETKRFFINTTIGVVGMYDPAKRFFKLKRNTDNMDKALSRRNVKPGAYFVLPVINFTTVRGIFGKILDTAFNPTTYAFFGTPVVSIVKASLTVNRTAYIQSIVELIESNFADGYVITKTAFGINGYIKQNNYDRIDVMPDIETHCIKQKPKQSKKKTKLTVTGKIIQTNDDVESSEYVEISNITLKPDIHLKNYSPQSPVLDSMRTSLFVLPNVNNSMWTDLSIWNHSFAHKIKYDSVNVFKGRENYNFKYLLQKDKKAPLAVIYPSTGDGARASHPVMFAKLFYDAGYSVIIQGNPFQWEFVKSMPEHYRPGIPEKDAKMMRITTNKIIKRIQKKHGKKYQFENKVILGTSLAGLDVLFMAEQESKKNTLGNTKFISICPPIDLIYAVSQLDNYAKELGNELPEDLKQKVAYASAKIVSLYQSRDDFKYEINYMPFTEEEAKIFTTFIMHSKLSDIIFTIENAPINKKSNIYEITNKMGFLDYVDKYIANKSDINKYNFKLLSISNYLKNANNYKIYHTVNDYFINQSQLKQLKSVAKGHLTIIDNGSHMGFLYRDEFLNNLIQTISENKNL